MSDQPHLRAIRDAVEQLEAISTMLRHITHVGAVPLIGPGVAGCLDSVARNLLDTLPPVHQRQG